MPGVPHSVAGKVQVFLAAHPGEWFKAVAIATGARTGVSCTYESLYKLSREGKILAKKMRKTYGGPVAYFKYKGEENAPVHPEPRHQ